MLPSTGYFVKRWEFLSPVKCVCFYPQDKWSSAYTACILRHIRLQSTAGCFKYRFDFSEEFTWEICSPFVCITTMHIVILFLSDCAIADRFSTILRCSVSCFISWPLRGELSWSCSHSVEDNAQEMFASHLGHDKHHSLCLSFILFPSLLRLVGSAFCLLRSLSCFLLALPKSVPCLEMFGFLYSITIYACVRMCVIQFVPKALCCLLIRAWWCTNCRCPKWQKTSSTWFVSSGVLKFALEIVHWIFFSLLWVKAYGDF